MRLFQFTLGVTLAALLSIGAYADFAKSKTYTEGLFADVPAEEWYAEPVKDAYEFGIMQGDSSTTFSPAGTLTAAEAITTADRIFATLKGIAIDTNAAGEWYAPYVKYAIDNGIMTEGMFDDYDAVITRGDMARLLAAVCGDLPKINAVKKLPDVEAGSLCCSSVLKLYNAGILTGNDGYGSFAPSSNLQRCEIAAMAVRIADSAKRIQKTFMTTPARTYGDAYGIIECINGSGRNGIANGWNYDNRFDILNDTGAEKSFISDQSDDRFMRLIRDFDPEDSGILNVELYGSFGSKRGGGYIAFQNAAEQNLIEITERNGRFVFTGTNEVTTAIECPSDAVSTAFILRIDLDYNTASLIINNTFAGTVNIDENAVLQRLVLGSKKVGEGRISLAHCKMNKNYVVADRFLVPASNAGEKPVGWNITGEFNLQRNKAEAGSDVTSVKAESTAGSVSTASRTFEPVNGNVDFETFILLPEAVSGASFAITSGGNDVIKIETKGSTFYCGDLKLRDYTENVWQNLHVEANTATGKALIKIDGKEVGTVDFAAEYFDGCTYTFAPDKDAVMWFDDLDIYCLVEHDDYPSMPVSAQTDDYNIGMNFCWLWRDTNSGEGWDSVSPFEEFDPYLGYYDEGLREVADWEIKWMVEHGIDFIHACWYSPNSVNKEPIKRERMSYQALHDGYMNAKYSDMMQFCIMWENNAGGAENAEQFKEYLWKYWKEYYFTDPRYVRLDNKAVLTVWNYSSMVSVFGGAEGAKEMIKWMEDDLKSIGYDGLILLFNQSGTASTGTYDAYASLGATGVFSYSYGTSGMSGDYQISCNQKNAEAAAASNGGHHIPTVSIGFNDVGRNETRDPVIPFDEHLKVCQNIKELLASKNTGTWKDKTLIVSTWNEFSEGTYVFPCRQNGFEYLENVRQVFGDTSADKAVLETRPTPKQIDRCSHMYPANHAPIRWFQFEQSSEQKAANATDTLIPVIKYDMSAGGTSGWKQMFSIENYNDQNGVISGRSKDSDFAMTTNNMKPFDAEDATVIHIRHKSSEVGSIEVFYTTDKSPAWDGSKSKSVRITKTGEFVDYYLNMEGANWTDNITAVRIDPGTVAGAEFEISLIEFMKFPQVDESSKPAVTVNTYDLSFTFDPVVTPDGDLEIVGEASHKGFYSLMQLYHEWDRFTGGGVLTLYDRADNRYVFTVGSDKVLVNGNEKSLGFTFKLHDGLPVFHIGKLCDLLGYQYEKNGVRFNVHACPEEEYAALEKMVDNQWEFNMFGEVEGFSGQSCGLSTGSDGLLEVRASNTDPAIIHTVSFGASDYTHLVLGVRYTEVIDKAKPQFFFTTSASGIYTADKCVNAKYDLEGKKYGDIVEAVFDLNTNSLFRGTITGARLDTHASAETVYVDYVRFENRGIKGSDSQYLIACEDSNQWYFDTDGNAENWNPQSVNGLKASGGALTGISANSDPGVIRSVDFRADDYQVIVVGVRYIPEYSKMSGQMYFRTSEDGAWGADRCVTASYQIPPIVNEGDTVEIVFDMTYNAKWRGYITHLRYDMFGAADTAFEIDYIRMYKKSGYTAPASSEPEGQLASSKPVTGITGSDDSSIRACVGDCQWNFDTDGDAERWNPQSVTGMKAKNGVLTGVSASTDPAVIREVNLKASDYQVLIVGMRYIPQLSRTSGQMFFRTSNDGAWAADRCVSASYIIPAGVKEGDIVEVVFDMTKNAKWAGTITHLRFDMFESADTAFEIDYILTFMKEGCEAPSTDPAAQTDTPKQPSGQTASVSSGLSLIECIDENQWFFDTDGDNERWNPQSVNSLKTKGGVLSGVSASSDPAVIREVKFGANDYQAIVVGIRYTPALAKSSGQMFFRTSEDGAWAADRCVSAKYLIPEPVYEGDLVEIVFNMESNAKWKGDITHLRFDMFGAADTAFEIDYIRMYQTMG